MSEETDTPAPAYRQLADQFARVSRIEHAITILSWDQMVMMPPGGVAARGDALAELASVRHALLIAPELSDFFATADVELERPLGALADSPHAEPGLQQWERANLVGMHRLWKQAQAVPASLVKAQVLAANRCEHAWRVQRKSNDWAGFLENFREVVQLSREEADYRLAASDGTLSSPYEAMLDLHCYGDDAALIASIFSVLEARLPSLLERILSRQASVTSGKLDAGSRDSPWQTNDASSGAGYPIDAQRELNEILMRRLGFDFERGRLDVSAHPFSAGVFGDQRITTRFRVEDFADALLATAHETGHASYEAGLPARWSGQPVGSAVNMCLHESQSLLFEKHILMSRSFGRHFHPEIQSCLPGTASLSADRYWRQQTRVSPSLIRVDADEVTYPLHVILRHDIERRLINRDIEADDIPSLWDSGMQRYLGLSTDGNYTDGCLQDIHWTDGSFGYFPSYTLGAVNAAQLMSSIRQDCPDWQRSLAAGEVAFARDWLDERIWCWGSLFESQTLMQRATGETSNPEYLLRHLEARYLDEFD